MRRCPGGGRCPDAGKCPVTGGLTGKRRLELKLSKRLQTACNLRPLCTGNYHAGWLRPLHGKRKAAVWCLSVCPASHKTGSAFRIALSSRVGPSHVRGRRGQKIGRAVFDIELQTHIHTYTGWAKKWGHRLITIILSNPNRLKFFSVENSYLNL